MSERQVQDGLLDAREMNKKHPDSFWCPSNEKLDGLEVGMIVKIAHNRERFWVKLTSVTGDILSGLVDSYPMHEHPFGYGDVIKFERRHILEVI